MSMFERWKLTAQTVDVAAPAAAKLPAGAAVQLDDPTGAYDPEGQEAQFAPPVEDEPAGHSLQLGGKRFDSMVNAPRGPTTLATRPGL